MASPPPLPPAARGRGTPSRGGAEPVELAAADVLVDDESPAPVALVAGAPSVLVVEDDDAMRAWLVALFSDAYTVYAATSGPEAIATFAHVRPSVLVCDVGLPGADGFAVAAALKKEPWGRAVPVVFLTARDRPEDLIRGINVGARHYLKKPVPPLVLRDKVDRLAGVAKAR